MSSVIGGPSSCSGAISSVSFFSLVVDCIFFLFVEGTLLGRCYDVTQQRPSKKRRRSRPFSFFFFLFLSSCLSPSSLRSPHARCAHLCRRTERERERERGRKVCRRSIPRAARSLWLSPLFPTHDRRSECRRRFFWPPPSVDSATLSNTTVVVVQVQSSMIGSASDWNS